MMFDSAELEASDSRMPRNTETPVKAGELDAGRYGNATTTPSATSKTRMILRVGSAHSLGKSASTIWPSLIWPAMRSTSLIAP